MHHQHSTDPSAPKPSPLRWILRRDIHRGFEALRHYYGTLRRITDWSWPYWGEKMNPVPVHVLVGKADWLLAAWLLASWFHFTEQNWRIVIHDDGSLPDGAATMLLRMFPGSRIIPRAEADTALERVLMPYPFCLDYRRMNPLALKIFDMPHFSEGNRLVIIASGVLFFSHPKEIIDWTHATSHDCWFNEDAVEGALIGSEEALEELAVRIWPRVNSALCLISKEAFDLDFCDRALAQTSLLGGDTRRIEQTLFALCASRHDQGGLLPRHYEVTLGKYASPGVISRHYAGPVYDRFYGEGLKRLRNELFVARD